MNLHYNPPKIVKKLFNSFHWNSVEKKVLLTFDDGPNPATTEIILEELEKYSVRSIFFCVGENLEKYSDLAKEIISQGHEIGNHTYQHKKITKIGKDELQYSISKVQEIAFDLLNYEIKYFRPPHGRFSFSTDRLLKQNKLQNVMWSLLTYDYKNDLNIVKFAITKYLTNDSIIVLHDNNKSKDIIVDSIKIIFEEVEKRNYQFGTPTECLKYSSS